MLVTLIKYVFYGPPVFDRIGGPLLGVFPMITMFLVTSVTMLRERTTGTLERLMTMPLAKIDLLAGYGGAFALLAAVQAALVSTVAFWLLDLHVAGVKWGVFLLAISNAVLGMRSGSSSARSRGPSSRRCSSCLPSSSRSYCSAACSRRAARWPGRSRSSRGGCP